MYKIENFLNNDDIKVINKLGAFTVIEYQRDLSVMPSESLIAYYCSAMNVRKRQVSSVTGESAIKPEYTGDGTLVLEPTYKHILLVDLADWNGSIVLDDGLFLACDATLKHKAVARSNISSAVAGNEGLFNLGIVGRGILCLESPCPKEELVEITLDNDVLKVDGNMAIAWSGSLDFTVERSGKTLIGSVASGEGLVNGDRGTGKVLLAPVTKGIV